MSRQSNNFIEDATTECLVKLTGVQKETYNLYEAIANNDLEAAKRAIANGADINSSYAPCAPESEETPLDAAIYWANSFDCSPNMIKLLRENGARNLNRDLDEYVQEGNDCLLEDIIKKSKYKH